MKLILTLFYLFIYLFIYQIEKISTYKTFFLKIDANRGMKARIKSAVGVLTQKTRFSNARIAER